MIQNNDVAASTTRLLMFLMFIQNEYFIINIYSKIESVLLYGTNGSLKLKGIPHNFFKKKTTNYIKLFKYLVHHGFASKSAAGGEPESVSAVTKSFTRLLVQRLKSEW